MGRAEMGMSWDGLGWDGLSWYLGWLGSAWLGWAKLGWAVLGWIVHCRAGMVGMGWAEASWRGVWTIGNPECVSSSRGCCSWCSSCIIVIPFSLRFACLLALSVSNFMVGAEQSYLRTLNFSF